MEGFSQSSEFNYNFKDTSELNKAIDHIYSKLDANQTIDLDRVNTIQEHSLILNDTLTFFKFSKRICRIYFGRNNLNEEAILFLKESQKKLGNPINPIGDFNNVLGIFYNRINFHSEALEHYYKSVQWFKKYDPINATIPLGNLAEIYFKNKEFEKALNYNEQALSYSLKLEDQDERLSNITYDYFRIGSIHHQLGQNKIAESYFEKALTTSREFDNKGALFLFTIGKALEFYVATGNIEKGKKMIFEGENLCKESDICEKRTAAYYILQKSKYYLMSDDITQAIEPEKIVSLNSALEKEVYLYAVDYYKQNDNIQKTIEYYNKLNEFNNNSIIENRKIAFSNIEEKYTNKKLTQKNKELTKDIESRGKTIMIIFFILILILSLLISQFLHNHRYKILNHELQVKKEDLEKTNQELTSSNEELERFTFIASHDLKTPLRNIISFTSLLEKKLNVSEDNNIKEYLFYIKEGGLRLNNLISDTLEFSKFSNKEFKLEQRTIDLNELLDKLEISILNTLKESNAKIIRPTNLPYIKSHYHSLVILFQNIIENGIKYNKSENPIIKIELKENSDFHSLFISDNGIGIAEEYRDKIFTMFFRLHNHQEYGGSGLGLSICKKIAKRLNIEIHIHSNKEGGSTFEIKLPISNIETQNELNKKTEFIV